MSFYSSVCVCLVLYLMFSLYQVCAPVATSLLCLYLPMMAVSRLQIASLAEILLTTLGEFAVEFSVYLTDVEVYVLFVLCGCHMDTVVSTLLRLVVEMAGGQALWWVWHDTHPAVYFRYANVVSAFIWVPNLVHANLDRLNARF